MTSSPLMAYRNSDVAYLMQNSHHKILGGSKKTGIVPSLMLQAVHLNPESCRFRDPELVREVEWSQSMEHCGMCQFCKPQPGGEVAARGPVKKS